MRCYFAKDLKRRLIATGGIAGCLLVVLASGVLAESSKGRVGYRAHGRYARPAPPRATQQPLPIVGTAFPGNVPRTQQKYYRVLPPYASNTQPFHSNPHYPSGVPIDPRALPSLGATRFITVLPQPVVYLPTNAVFRSPAEVLQAVPQPIAPPQQVGTAPSGAPIYVVVQAPPAPPAPSAPPASTPPAVSPAAPTAAPAPPRGPGGLRFRVQPADAQVFLDDRLLGEGAALSAQLEAMVLDAGVYMLEVRHPDHRSERLFFGVYADTEVEVEIDLTRRDGRRRSWVDIDS